MANKKQRLARRHFVETQREAAQAKEAAPPSDSENKTALKPSNRKILRKHPLRVPGKKPGDGCFICKSSQHVAKACPQKLGKDRKTICLLCRKLGHTLKTCPTKVNGLERKCYNCGEIGHRLTECKQPLKEGGSTFASCLLCKEKGHLSKNCPSNTHGIYPKGGSCKVCGSVTHLAKDCPERESNRRPNGIQQGKLFISKEVAPTSGNHAKRIVLRSGDDLEDDFIDGEGDESEGNKKNGSSKRKGQAQEQKGSQSNTWSSKSVVKKARNSPKFVNFKF